MSEPLAFLQEAPKLRVESGHTRSPTRYRTMIYKAQAWTYGSRASASSALCISFLALLSELSVSPWLGFDLVA